VDLSLHFASVLDHVGVIDWDMDVVLGVLKPYWDKKPDEDILDLETETIDIILKHKRYIMLGHSGAWPISDWLLNWELAVQINRPYNFQTANDDFGIEIPDLLIRNTSTVGFVLGVAYSGFRDTRIFAEFSKRFFVDDYGTPLYKIDSPSIALGYLHNLLDDLELELIFSLLGWSTKYGFFESGWIARLQLNYNIIDEIKLTAGYIYYKSEAELDILSGLTDHDRLYLNFRWDFTIH